MDFGAPSHAKRALCKLKRGTLYTEVAKNWVARAPCASPLFLRHVHTTSLTQNEGISNALGGLKIKALGGSKITVTV